MLYFWLNDIPAHGNPPDEKPDVNAFVITFAC